MKKIITVTLSTALLLTLGFVSSCTKDTVELETKRVRGILKNQWKLQSVMVDGIDQTTVYKNFAIKFTDTEFTVTNGSTVWPASGTWNFTDDTANTIRRSDGLLITIEEATTTKLVLSFTWAGNKTIGPGRIPAVSGVHVFTFSN